MLHEIAVKQKKKIVLTLRAEKNNNLSWPLRSEPSAHRSISSYPFPLRICETKNSRTLKLYEGYFATDWKGTGSAPAAFPGNGPRSLHHLAPRPCGPDSPHKCRPSASLSSAPRSGHLCMRRHNIPWLRALRTSHRDRRTSIPPSPLRNPLEKNSRYEEEKTNQGKRRGLRVLRDKSSGGGKIGGKYRIFRSRLIYPREEDELAARCPRRSHSSKHQAYRERSVASPSPLPALYSGIPLFSPLPSPLFTELPPLPYFPLFSPYAVPPPCPIPCPPSDCIVREFCPFWCFYWMELVFGVWGLVFW